MRHRRDVMLAVHRDLPAALGQEQRQFLGEALEAAVRSRNAARSEDQDTGLSIRHMGDLNRDGVRPTRGRIDSLGSFRRKRRASAAARERDVVFVNDTGTIALIA